MVKKPTEQITDMVNTVKNHTEDILKIYQDEYADYGMDDISNDLINICSYMEQVRMKLQYAMVKEGDYDYKF